MSTPGAHVDGQPVELILARNLISLIRVAAFLVDADGHLAFYNATAGAMLGRQFEEIGRLPREQWNAEFGPLDEHDAPLASDRLPLSIALREGHPAFGRFRIRGEQGIIGIEVGAIPLTGPDGYHGAIVVLWPAPTGGATG